jgi:hypothetical protein
MGIEEGDEVQGKGIHNIHLFILNKIVRENVPLRYRNRPGHQADLNKQTKKKPLHG